jgi:transposase
VIYQYREDYPVQAMSKYLGVSRSGYYEWIKRMDQADPDQENMDWVKTVYLQNRRVYDYRRVTHALRQVYGVKLNHKAVYRLMRKLGVRSVARPGNCLDNAAMENFFGHLKEEAIYRTKLLTFQQAQELIDDYIHFYNHDRIQLKTKLTPFQQRCQFH